MTTKITSFAAPWDGGVKLLTILVSGILEYYLIGSVRDTHHVSGWEILLAVGLVALVLVLGLSLMISNYVVDVDGIVIRRTFWKQRIGREAIASIGLVTPLAQRAFGLLGVWGFYGQSGIAYSRIFGFHIVAANSMSERVIITRHKGLSIVISPVDAHKFIEAFNNVSGQNAQC